MQNWLGNCQSRGSVLRQKNGGATATSYFDFSSKYRFCPWRPCPSTYVKFVRPRTFKKLAGQRLMSESYFWTSDRDIGRGEVGSESYHLLNIKTCLQVKSQES